MKRKLYALLALLTLFASGVAVAHGGKSHRLMGTVQALQDDRLVVRTADGRETTVALVEATRYEKAGKPARRADLEVGARVSVHLTEDDRTATVVKIGAASSP